MRKEKKIPAAIFGRLAAGLGIAVFAFGIFSQSASAAGPGIKQWEDDHYYYVVDGSIDTSKNGLVQSEGRWYYLESGEWIRSKHAFVEFGGGKFLVANGLVASDKNGLMQDPENKDDWYFLSKGQVQSKKSGLVQYNGAWFYVNNGLLNTVYNGFVEYDGGQFMVARGRILTEKNGLAQDPNNANDWYFLANGQVQLKKTGLAEYDGGWFYIENGKYANGYTGTINYNGEEFLIENGRVHFIYKYSGFFNVGKMTPADITWSYRQILDATYNKYDVEPSTDYPYSVGKVSDAHLQNGLQAANFVRMLAGLTPVSLNSDYNNRAQYGAVVTAANRQLNHYPSQPSGMSDEFYQAGYQACSKSNLHMGSTLLSFSVFSYMEDGGSFNTTCVGHRRWILNPKQREIGFGCAGSYSAMYVIEDDWNADVDLPDYRFIAWPSSGNFPNSFMGSQEAWSVVLNPEKFKSPSKDSVVITMTDQYGRQQVLTPTLEDNPGNNREAYCSINYTNYGYGPAIIFRPGTSIFAPDVEYTHQKFNGPVHVEISGLQDKGGNAVNLSYDVNFFDM